jgi:hypothetical protein
VRVLNTGSREYLLYPVSMDSDYFSAAEVSWKSHLFLRRGANRRMDALFDDQQVPVVIPGGETVSGFVYTNLTLGLKYLEVDLRTDGEAHRALVRLRSCLQELAGLGALRLRPPSRRCSPEGPDSVDERNHLRLWLSPLRFEGMEVWVGQISRDFGVRLSSKTVVTHKIDPDVDDARFYLLQDLANSGGLAGLAYVKGVGAE